MPLNKSDIDKIDALFTKHSQPLRDMLFQHEQSLYGENRTSGLKGDVECLYNGMNRNREEMAKFRESKAKMQGAAGVLGIVGGAIATLLAKIFLGK